MNSIQELLEELLKLVPTSLDQIDIDKFFDHLLKLIDKGLKLSISLIPVAERLAIDVLDAMFAPKQILRQILIIMCIQASLLTFNSASEVIGNLLSYITESGRTEKRLIEQLHDAKSYTEWRAIASRLDELHGHEAWRHEEDSVLYDCRMVKKRINGTIEMLERGDVFDLMFRLRGGLSRDQFGMQHSGLFSRAMGGTKVVIERYHETMARALNFICDSPIADEEIPTDAKLAFFNETRHSYGRTALLLSGGAYLGYYHLGVVKALHNEGVLPRVISGASAGSIMTAIVGTKTEQELQELFRERDDMVVPDGIRTDFFRISYELKSEVARRLNYLVPQVFRPISSAVLSSIFDKKILNLDTEHFKKALMQDVGLWTFQEAFDRTGRIINITVAPMNSYDPPRLLNYLTAPHVCVWSAAAASCAIPGIFDSVSLIVKEPNGQFRPENEWTRQALLDSEEVKAAKMSSYSDGSIESDLPMQQLSELFNVNHFVVSQVNPHSFILSSLALKASVWSHTLYGALVGYVRFLTAQCRDWLKNIINFLIFRSKAPTWSSRRGFIQLLTQDYEGRDNDITIMPWSGHISPIVALMSAIKNPTNKEFFDVLRAAEKNTWPSINRIRAHCLIEMTLDKCVQKLRKRITEESERRTEAIVNAIEGTRKGKLDRTPSFYTSRSIVNLSGLSVSDPVPTLVRRSSVKHVTPDTTAHGDQDHIVTQQPYDPNYHEDDHGYNGFSRNNSTDFFNFTVQAGEIPLDGNSSFQTRGGNQDGDVHGEAMVRNASTDSLKEDHKIHKTTHMANFYYKKGHSSENLQNLI